MRSGFCVLASLLLAGCYYGWEGPDGKADGGGPASDSADDGAGDGGDGDDGDDDGDDTDGDDQPPVEEHEQDSQFPRLSHLQWENTVRDLFELDEITGLSDSFVGDPVAGGFDNAGAEFEVGATLWADYQNAAEALAEIVIADNAVFDRITPADTGQDASARGREFVETFGRKVYRRPLTNAEIDELSAVFDSAGSNYDDLDPFAAGVHLTLQAMLQSPYFVYRVVDGEPSDNGRIKLDGYEVASRLSYALWNSMPDPTLFDAAESGALDDADGVREQAARMLLDDKARDTVRDLHRQVLKVDLYLDRSKDPDLYPQFNAGLGPLMQEEAYRFIEDVVFDQGQGYAELLTSTHTFANAELAALYGIADGPAGNGFERVELDATERSGMLTRLGFLMSRAYQIDPDPIHRGAFISFELLCNEQPPLPDDVSAVEPDPTKTNRQRVEDHTGTGTCGAGCHNVLINPAGFAFENYDAIGAWRTIDNGQPVDAAAAFTFDGEQQEYENAVEFSNIMADSKQAHDCYTRHLLEYMYGRVHRAAGRRDGRRARHRVGRRIPDRGRSAHGAGHRRRVPPHPRRAGGGLIMKDMNRRRFLIGTGGAVMALPFLHSLMPRSARAGGQSPSFFVAMRQANGVQCATDGETDRFWPGAHGPLTSAGMAAENQAVGELSDYAERMLIVSGTNFAFPGNGCGHSGGGNQCLTAARVSDIPAGNESLAEGESVDNVIARQLNDAGVEPLTLYAGRMSGYINEVLSYRGPQDLRPADPNPWNVFEREFGLVGVDDEIVAQIQARRTSVNDLVKDQMGALLGNARLSALDRQRLELHRDSIREIEVNLTCSLPPQAEIDAMEAMADTAQDNDNMEIVARMQADLIALAFACELNHAATLQIGDGNDGTEYIVDGTRLPNFHMVSHRIYAHGSEGDPIPGAEMMHHEIDRIHARMFKHLLDKLTEYVDPMGVPLLDNTIALWTNDLSNRYHSYTNIPQVIAGNANGYLRQGQYVDAGGVTHNKFFNTILNAVGCTKEDGTGAPVDDFGDSSLEGGEIAVMKA